MRRLRTKDGHDNLMWWINDKHKQRVSNKICQLGLTECWPWLGGLDKDGYGRYCPYESGVMIGQYPAHRVAYAMFIEDPLDLIVCHTCDNPICCNYKTHLFVGTYEDNSLDMVTKQRQALGAKNGHNKLSELDVLSIRAHYSQNARDVAQEYHVSPALIRAIWDRRLWAHI